MPIRRILHLGTRALIAVLLFRLITPVPAALGQTEETSARIFVLRVDELGKSKERLRDGDKHLQPPLDELLGDAERALKAAPFSVMSKSRTPPSGDKHDYMSMGPYWWPDTTKQDGLPYIRRDGDRNPESLQGYDRANLGSLVGSVETLALAYFLTDNEAYAEHATKRLRVWFLDPATRMNPHLEYGQAIPGITDGRGIGIIETRSFARVVDAIGMIEHAQSWTDADRKGLQVWMAAFLDWLLNSEHGKDERDEHNNHGTWYDVQVAALALYTGQEDVARRVLEESKAMRFDKHILPDGSQPFELERTRSLSYSVMNLEGLSQLAELGRHVGVDLWHYESPSGGSIRKALDYLAPYANPNLSWPGEQITTIEPDLLLLHLRRAQFVYKDAEYAQLFAKLPADYRRTHRALLFFPKVRDGR